MYTKLIWTTGFVQYVLDNEYAQTLYDMYSMVSTYKYQLVTNMPVQLFWIAGLVQYVLDREYVQALYGMYSMLIMYNYWLVTNICKFNNRV